MKKLLIRLGICIILSVLIITLIQKNGTDYSYRSITYKVGSLKMKMALIQNPYTNSVVQGEGFWTMHDGTRIHYRNEGTGDPVLIVHGGPGEPYKKAWEGLKMVRQGYSFIYYDQRGCGQSSRPIDRLSTCEWKECQTELTKKLGIEAALMDIEEIRRIMGTEKITIIGHSYGAVIAALYTAEFPDKVNKLVMVSPAPSIRFPIDPSDDINTIMSKNLPADTNAEFEKYRENLWNPEQVLKMNEEELSIQDRNFFYFYDEYHKNIGLPNSVDLINNLVDKENIGGWLPYGYAWSFPNTFDYRNDLKAITSPALILWGDKDITKESWAKDYSRYISNSRVAMIGNVGHFMFEENPAAFADVINDFLQE